MEEELSEEKKLELIKELLDKLIITRKTKVDISLDLKTIEDNLKQDIAEVKNYKKKDGTVDVKEVKLALVKDGIAIEKLAQENKLQKKYDLLEEYITDIRNGSYNEDIIDTYLLKLNLVEDNKSEISEIKDTYTGVLDSDTIKAVDKLTKIIEKEYLIAEKSKLDEANGVKTKSKGSSSTNFDIDALVRELAAKLNIKIK